MTNDKKKIRAIGSPELPTAGSTASHHPDRRHRNSASIKRLARRLLKAIADRVVPERIKRGREVAEIRKSRYFDNRYYLETYKDVAAKGVGPVEHFVATGWKKGRRPNRWFDTKWYLRAYPEVEQSKVNPLLYYIRKGAAEGHWPSKAFDPQKYLLDHPDVASAGMEPLYHAINYGQFEGRVGVAGTARVPSYDPHFLKTSDVKNLSILTTASPAPSGAVSTQSLSRSTVSVYEGALPRVSVIVPVYGDRELTIRCLDSVVRSIAHNKSFAKLIIIDDVGPDETLRASLSAYAALTAVELHVNSSNLGFVRSTNLGMALAGRTDVVLLNSDTEVHADWLDRLVAHAAADPRVGTITPLSNNATICSFPDIGENVEIHSGHAPADIDATAAVINRGRSVPIPTGVGFCMYVRRTAINECGDLDAEAFGAGYGEETDFCQRIQAKGWQNLLATDVFVFHAGGASFGTSSNARKEKAGAIMRERFPDYEPSVARWVSSDPALTMRLALEIALVRQRRAATILHITHAWGGGIERHISDLAITTGTDAAHVVLMLGRIDTGLYELKLMLPDGTNGWRQFSFRIRTADAAVELIGAIGPTRLHLHHGLPDMSFVISVLVGADLEYDLTIHDYWPICARMNLSVDGVYCGEPDERGCLSCLAKTENLAGQDVIIWREQSRFLIQGATRLIAPSTDVATRISQRFPSAPRPIVAPHEPDHYRPLSRTMTVRYRGAQPFRIAAVGAFNLTKGGGFLLDVIEAADRLGLVLNWMVIGYFYPPLDKRAARLAPTLTCTGPYDHSKVEEMLREADADIVFYPQRIPETYSYTLTEAFKTGMLTLTSNIGAFVERTDGVPGCWSYSTDDSPEAVALKISEILNALGTEPLPSGVLIEPTDYRASFYEREYLAPLATARSPAP